MSADVETESETGSENASERAVRRRDREPYQGIDDAELDTVLGAIGRAIDENYGDAPSVHSGRLRDRFGADSLPRNTIGRVLVELADGRRDGGDIEVSWFSNPKNVASTNVFIARRNREPAAVDRDEHGDRDTQREP